MATIVLIHGLWLTPLSWEGWKGRFEAKGHTVLAPAWPEMDKPVEELRRDTSGYERLGLREIVDSYEQTIRGLDQPPIIMGHSFGGLITQLLLDRGMGAAGVAIHPAPIKGVLILPPAQLKVSWTILKSPANRHRAVMLTPEEFHYGFTNLMTLEESKPIYDRLAVPGPGRTLFQAAFANFNPKAESKVDTRKDDRAPLLLLAGGKDHTVPGSTVRAAHKLYRHSNAVVDLREYPDRSHYTFAQQGWEDVADGALDWAIAHARAA